MNGVIFDESKTRILDALLASTLFTGSNVQVMLYDTITSLSHTDVLATLAAHEAAFSGYARQSVLSWAAAALTADFHARSQGSTVTFGNGGLTDSTLLTGWAFVDMAGGRVIQAGLYDTPFVVPAGMSYLTTPFFTYTGEIGSEP